MTASHRLSLVSISAALTVLGFACGSSRAATPDADEEAFLKANDAAMTAMMTDMAVKPTGDVDRDFALMMIPHHQGGVDMCRALLAHGRNPKLKVLCRNIITTQSQEITEMRAAIGDPEAGAHKDDMADMPGMSHDHHM